MIDSVDIFKVKVEDKVDAIKLMGDKMLKRTD